jgi:hypothetical protein
VEIKLGLFSSHSNAKGSAAPNTKSSRAGGKYETDEKQLRTFTQP